MPISSTYDFAKSIKIPLFMKQEGSHLKADGSEKISSGYLSTLFGIAEIGSAAAFYSNPVGAAIMTIAGIGIIIHGTHKVKEGREEVKNGERLLIEADEIVENASTVTANTQEKSNSVYAGNAVMFPTPQVTQAVKAEIVEAPKAIATKL